MIDTAIRRLSELRSTLEGFAGRQIAFDPKPEKRRPKLRCVILKRLSLARKTMLPFRRRIPSCLRR